MSIFHVACLAGFDIVRVPNIIMHASRSHPPHVPSQVRLLSSRAKNAKQQNQLPIFSIVAVVNATTSTTHLLPTLEQQQ